MVLEDSFGLASAKEVVQRAVELAKIIQAGKEGPQHKCLKSSRCAKVPKMSSE